jgi:hypothetical protein
MSKTPVDIAFENMDASDAARLRFYERLADAELFMLLLQEADGEDVEPEVFDVEGGTVRVGF